MSFTQYPKCSSYHPIDRDGNLGGRASFENYKASSAAAIHRVPFTLLFPTHYVPIRWAECPHILKEE